MLSWSVSYNEDELQEVRQNLAVSQAAWERAKADVKSCGCEKSRMREAHHYRQVEKYWAILSKANRGVTKL